MDEIKCIDCGKWEIAPAEWSYLSPADYNCLADGNRCERCDELHSLERYRRQGNAEMLGMGLND